MGNFIFQNEYKKSSRGVVFDPMRKSWNFVFEKINLLFYNQQIQTQANTSKRKS